MSEERLVRLDDDTVLVGEAARQYQEAIDEAVRGLRLAGLTVDTEEQP